MSTIASNIDLEVLKTRTVSDDDKTFVCEVFRKFEDMFRRYPFFVRGGMCISSSPEFNRKRKAFSPSLQTYITKYFGFESSVSREEKGEEEVITDIIELFLLKVIGRPHKKSRAIDYKILVDFTGNEPMCYDEYEYDDDYEDDYDDPFQSSKVLNVTNICRSNHLLSDAELGKAIRMAWNKGGEFRILLEINGLQRCRAIFSKWLYD